jgi:Ca2+/H+ antiporter
VTPCSRSSLHVRIVLVIAVLLVNFAISDGRTNYLEGFAMMMAYVSIALVTWYVPALLKDVVTCYQ